MKEDQELTTTLNRILIVDDQSNLLNSLRVLIKTLGYESYCAASGEEALNIYHQYRPSIRMVLIDYLMPEMNGKELLSSLLAINADIPIYISSGNLTDDQEGNLLELGASGFLSKPFNCNKLKDLLDKNLANPT